MRLDHIAFRVKSKDKAVFLLEQLLGYSKECPFELVFDDGTTCECIALAPPETSGKFRKTKHYKSIQQLKFGEPFFEGTWYIPYHAAPEIFVSEGKDNSIVKDWVNNHNGIGGIHHIAYEVFNIDNIVGLWKSNGVQFSSDIIDCPEDDLRQIFTKPLDELGGLIIELIQRGDKGFCKSSVKKLMESTSGKPST